MAFMFLIKQDCIFLGGVAILVKNLLNFSRWFERATMTVILVNCVTLGMYQPCEDTSICDQKCEMLKVERT